MHFSPTDIQKAEKFQQYYFTSGEKLFLLEQFEMCLKMFLTDWEELLENYKKEKEIAEEEYISGKRVELPNMIQIFIRSVKKCANNKNITNKNTENIMQ